MNVEVADLFRRRCVFCIIDLILRKHTETGNIHRHQTFIIGHGEIGADRPPPPNRNCPLMTALCEGGQVMVHLMSLPTANQQKDKTAIAEQGPVVSVRHLKQVVAALLIGFASVLIFLAIDGLTMSMRTTLFIFFSAIIGWTVLELPETSVALAGAVALAVVGAIPEDLVYRSLGNDIIWLLLSAFVIAAVLRHVGLIEQVTDRLMPKMRSIRSMFWTLTLLTFATAFVIPSTSARAAILMPVYLGLSSAIGNTRVSRALGLLFPTVILLSAGASLIGAGAHLVASGFLLRFNGTQPDFIGWLVLAGPFSLITCLIACAILLHVFMSKEERDMAPDASLSPGRPTALSRQQVAVAATVGGTVLMFSAQSFHGIDISLVAVVAALVLCTPNISGLTLKAALKNVEWNLLLFMAGTLVIGEALIETGTAQMLTDRLVSVFRQSMITAPVIIISFAVIIATFSHLVITSRTARATVLIPAFALPLSAFGVDPAVLVMVVTLASGFCQMTMVSAKPVVLFGGLEPAAFTQGDLRKLGYLLVPPFMFLLILVATVLWPLQGFSRGH
ncbi:SLC13 family permease [Agrobacterium sp. NPDC090273]|uniref:SLC13 family permease n=1 Tax=Agrobacterium sp. NPDC090273 TaxID=3363919 RepID=UPI00383BB693